MGEEATTKTVREPARRPRTEREESVRKKYDFSVIRALRQQRGLTIERFAKICGLSYAPISRIETNLIKPNLDTLDKIASGLGVTTGHLVSLAERRDVTKITGRDLRSGGFSFKSFTVDGYEVAYGHAQRGDSFAELDLGGAEYECILVRSGALDVTVGEKTMRVTAGESIRYDRLSPHRISAVEDAEVVVFAHGKR